MTERLYYTDCYRTEFDAAVTAVAEIDGRPALVLDRTCFYPTSGGQPYRHGHAGRTARRGRGRGRRRHLPRAGQPADPALVGQTVHGEIDWPRRFDHMQQHSGQHLISQVFHRLFGYETVSVHFGDDGIHPRPGRGRGHAGRAGAGRGAGQRAGLPGHPHHRLFRGRQRDRQRAAAPPAQGERPDPHRRDRGTDWSACGGTHVRTTAEIGPIKFVRQQRMRGQARISASCAVSARWMTTRASTSSSPRSARSTTTRSARSPVLVARDMERLKELQRQVDGVADAQACLSWPRT